MWPQTKLNPDEVAVMHEAARTVLKGDGRDEIDNPEYAVGFEHGFMHAVRTLPQSRDVLLPLAARATPTKVTPTA